jgi:hypothetical protein
MGYGSWLAFVFFHASANEHDGCRMAKNLRSGVGQNDADNILDDVLIVESPENPCDEATDKESRAEYI